PIAAIRPSRTRRSAAYRGAPVPSTTVPPRIKISLNSYLLLVLGCERSLTTQNQNLLGQAHAINLRRVPGDNLLLLGFGHSLEVLGDPLLGMRPGAVRVGVVRGPHQGVDPDRVALAHRHRVLDEGELDVFLPVIAR